MGVLAVYRENGRYSKWDYCSSVFTSNALFPLGFVLVVIPTRIGTAFFPSTEDHLNGFLWPQCLFHCINWDEKTCPLWAAPSSRQGTIIQLLDCTIVEKAYWAQVWRQCCSQILNYGCNVTNSHSSPQIMDCHPERDLSPWVMFVREFCHSNRKRNWDSTFVTDHEELFPN